MRNIEQIIIHRTDPSAVGMPATARGVSRMFRTTPEVSRYTGGKVPYHDVIEPDGDIVHLVDWQYVTPHALSYNTTSIAIALIGDFRAAGPSPRQMMGFVAHLARVIHRFPEAEVSGHTALPQASAHPDKECPGALLDLSSLERAARLLAETLLSQEQATHPVA